MRIPLLLEADPRDAMTGPRVMLPAGRWKFSVVKHIINAKIMIGVLSELDEMIFHDVNIAEALGPAVVCAHVDVGSDEKRLTVFAELVK